MRVLLVVPPWSKTDPLWGSLSEEFERRLDASTAVSYGERYDGDPVDLVLPFDEMLLQWYNMRSSIPGRYRTIGCSFRFLDLYDFMREFKTVADSGLSALFTNCKSFVAQFGAGIPATFTYRPVIGAPKSKSMQEGVVFISAVDNLVDQDFSLAVRVAAKYGEKFALVINSGDEGRLPLALKDCLGDAAGHEYLMYQPAPYFIPTPRISDYRGGVIPIEYFKAVQYGCTPILVKHPLVQEFANEASNIQVCDSLKSLDACLEAAVKGEDRKPPFCDTPSVAQFVKSVVTVYRRLTDAA